MSNSRSFVPVVLLLAVAAGGRAEAADLPSRRDPYVATGYAAPVPTWQGLYAGVHAGGGFGKVGPANTSGLVGGAQVGYNVQLNNVVVGGEADLSASGVRNNSFTEKTRQKWLGSLRARAGYAVGNVLPYVTGGVAMGTTQIKGFNGHTDDTHAGYVVGGGAEMMMNPNMTVRAEYLYYGLEDAKYPGGPHGVNNSVNVIRAGANYKF